MRLLYVPNPVTFTLNALTIAHGSVTNTSGYPGPQGAGLLNGSPLYRGGTVSISNSTFAYNSALNTGGGLANFGGTVSISNSTFAHNSAFYGGGLYMQNGDTVSINNSTFAYNSATSDGGGLTLFVISVIQQFMQIKIL
jgi:hypothetical protein